MGDKGFFGDLFDFNGDGKLDSFEKAVDFAAFTDVVEKGKKDRRRFEDTESAEENDD